MVAHEESPYAVGQFGHFTGGVSHYSGLLRIDPSATDLSEDDALDLGSVYCNFGFEQAHGQVVAALTQDGRLHVAEVRDWNNYKTLQLLPDGGTSCPGRMTLGNGVAYVTPAGEGVVYEVDLSSLQVARVFHVGGNPGSTALADYRHPLAP